MDALSGTLWIGRGKTLDKKSVLDFRRDMDVDPEVL